ncbi:MAG TPA: MarR family transcriptional regulator [Thermoanaerobaculia bacterium]
MKSRVAEEIKQRRPFRTQNAEATVALLRTADVVRRRVTAVIEPHGITGQQYNVLRILRGAGDQGLPTLEIAERMIEQAPGITRLLDRLEAKGLVRRERCERDRRQVLCWITPASLRLLAELDEAVVQADDAALGPLTKKEVTLLIQLLDKVRGSRAP